MTTPDSEDFGRWVTDTYPSNLMMRNILLDNKAFSGIWQARQPEIDALNQKIQELSLDALEREGTIDALKAELSRMRDVAIANKDMRNMVITEKLALKAEVESLLKDAKRYRYLRNKASTSFVYAWEANSGIVKDRHTDDAMTDKGG